MIHFYANGHKGRSHRRQGGRSWYTCATCEAVGTSRYTDAEYLGRTPCPRPAPPAGPRPSKVDGGSHLVEQVDLEDLIKGLGHG